MTDQTSSDRPRPVVFCVLDGWGYREDPTDNAVALGARRTSTGCGSPGRTR